MNQIPCSQTTSRWHTHSFPLGKVSHHFRTRHFPLLQDTTHATHTYRRSSLGQSYYSLGSTVWHAYRLGSALTRPYSSSRQYLGAVVPTAVHTPTSFRDRKHAIVLSASTYHLPLCWQSALIKEEKLSYAELVLTAASRGTRSSKADNWGEKKKTHGLTCFLFQLCTTQKQGSSQDKYEINETQYYSKRS